MISKKPAFEALEQKIKELEIKLDVFKKEEKNWSIEKQFSESVIKSLPGIFYIFDEKGKFYRWNENSEKVTEYSTEEISKMSPFDFFEEEDQKMVADKIQEVFVKGRSNVEVNIVSKSGKKTPYYFTGAKITIGNVSHLFGLGIDITERKQVEEALWESEEKYRHLSEGTFEAVVWHDKGKIIEANEQYYEMFGYEPEELAGKNAISLTATPDSEKFMRDQISLGHLGPYEVVGMKKGGTEFPMEIRVKRMKYKGKMARMAAIRDLTERKQAEEALRESEERYRSLAENSLVGFWQITLEGYTTYINPAMCSMIDIESPKELSGQTYHSFFTSESLEMINHERAKRPEGRGSCYEGEIIGKKRWET